jgi:hypothetical protein
VKERKVCEGGARDGGSRDERLPRERERRWEEVGYTYQYCQMREICG